MTEEENLLQGKPAWVREAFNTNELVRGCVHKHATMPCSYDEKAKDTFYEELAEKLFYFGRDTRFWMNKAIELGYSEPEVLPKIVLDDFKNRK